MAAGKPMTLEIVFTVCAIVGGALFLVRLVLQLLGATSDLDTDLHVGTHDTSHTDASFKVLSFQAITAFLTLFGLAGRALLLDSRVGPGIALVGACAGGALGVLIISRLMSGARRLQSVGTSAIEDAVGAQGEVYLNIAPDTGGQVQVRFHNRQGVYDAVTEGGDVLKTGTPITVTGVRGKTLVVRRV